MEHRKRTSLFASLALALYFISGSAAAQVLTASQIAVIESGAQRHVERYYNYYYERNPQALATQIFTLPWYTMGASGITARSTEAENLDFFSSAIAGLIERGWDKSIFTTRNVCVLGAGSAIVSGTNTRTRADGSVMSVGGVSYFLGTMDDDWRIISFASHQADKVVRCETE